jgi:8-oxo-dGTP pyrophosphatase MutT (NUDIX family)
VDLPAIGFDGDLRAGLAERIGAFALARHDHRELRPAAVAITVVDAGDGAAGFLLTRRASSLRAHAGQWALPGGRVDEGEDVVAAALRELHEEIGLDVGAQDVLGRLDAYPTRSGYAITPVVVWADESRAFRPNPDEVAAVYRIPLAELRRPDSPRFLTIPESDRPVVQLPISDHLIHAPTAAVLYQFREVALEGRATRVDHLEQPVFAWR